MQAAPFAPTATYVSPTSTPLAHIASGEAFVTRNDLLTVYALLSHRDVDVADGTRRWCVVIATKEHGPHPLGDVVPMLADAGVYRVTLRRPALYSLV